ncbi:MAG: MFS transporter [Chloroflexota bacterium]
MKRQPVVIAIMAAALAVMFSSGVRASFGLFLQPVTETLNIGRETFSLAIAISNLVYGLPLVGILADRIGSRWVMVAGGVLYAVGLFVMSRVMTGMGLHLSVGLMVGFALSATTYVVVLGAVGQLVPQARRSSVFGIITAVGSSGMFVFPPLAQLLIQQFGWQNALSILGVIILVVVGFAFGMPRQTEDNENKQSYEAELDESYGKILRRASTHQGYLLLIVGFFVCGFHVSFIGTHLPAFLSDNGLPALVGAGALSLVGVFNMVGSFAFGWLGDRYRKKNLLSVIYLGRAIVIALFIFLPITRLSAFVFGGAIGFLWLATVPLTSGTVSQIFGARYLSTLYGMVFLSHQIGAFIGVWWGGLLFDRTGTYDLVWYASIALGLLASVVHIPMKDEPLAREELTAPQAL